MYFYQLTKAESCSGFGTAQFYASSGWDSNSERAKRKFKSFAKIA
jgi:hypothetical protein